MGFSEKVQEEVIQLFQIPQVLKQWKDTSGDDWF